MGREVKRVPLDFSWPLRQPWVGYLTPTEFVFPSCTDCAYGERTSTGYSPEAWAIAGTFYPHMIVHAGAWIGAREHADRLAWHDKISYDEVQNLIAEGRLIEFYKRWDRNLKRWVERRPPSEVTAEEVNADNRGGGGLINGHDDINRMILVRFRCKRLGITINCSTCDGHGDIATDEQRKMAALAESEDPPEGSGWQLWETVSEGSPVSPVFTTPEELAAWMSQPGHPGTLDPITYDGALAFIRQGWAPSLVTSTSHGVEDGPSYVARTRPYQRELTDDETAAEEATWD